MFIVRLWDSSAECWVCDGPNNGLGYFFSRQKEKAKIFNNASEAVIFIKKINDPIVTTNWDSQYEMIDTNIDIHFFRN